MKPEVKEIKAPAPGKGRAKGSRDYWETKKTKHIALNDPITQRELESIELLDFKLPDSLIQLYKFANGQFLTDNRQQFKN